MLSGKIKKWKVLTYPWFDDTYSYSSGSVVIVVMILCLSNTVTLIT